MARYEHLPIYRKSFELAIYLERSVGNFGRYHKYGLGVRLLQAAQDVLARVVRAQNLYGGQRCAELAELRVQHEVLKNLLHLAKEVQAFKSFKSYGHAAGLAVEVSKQTEGWLKSCRELRAPESRPVNPPTGERP